MSWHVSVPRSPELLVHRGAGYNFERYADPINIQNVRIRFEYSFYVLYCFLILYLIVHMEDRQFPDRAYVSECNRCRDSIILRYLSAGERDIDIIKSGKDLFPGGLGSYHIHSFGLFSSPFHSIFT